MVGNRRLENGVGAPRTSELQELVLSAADVEDFLQQVVEMAAGVIKTEVSAGITMIRDGHPTTVASSDRETNLYDEIQYRHETGPCLTAARTGEVVLIDDAATERRFGDYPARASKLGLRSSLSLPLDGGDHAVGALNIYSRRPHTFGTQEQAEGQRFAGEASRALRLVVRLARHVEQTEQLQRALTSRTVIDQAMGVIMGQNRCDAEAAFAVLRSASQHRNVKLRVIAQEIVDGVGSRPARTAPPAE